MNSDENINYILLDALNTLSEAIDEWHLCPWFRYGEGDPKAIKEPYLEMLEQAKKRIKNLLPRIENDKFPDTIVLLIAKMCTSGYTSLTEQDSTAVKNYLDTCPEYRHDDIATLFPSEFSEWCSEERPNKNT